MRAIGDFMRFSFQGTAYGMARASLETSDEPGLRAPSSTPMKLITVKV